MFDKPNTSRVGKNCILLLLSANRVHEGVRCSIARPTMRQVCSGAVGVAAAFELLLRVADVFAACDTENAKVGQDPLGKASDVPVVI